jgi:hypothetical protein
MGIQKFTFSPSLTRGFTGFGYELYQGDPCWIPPFEDELIAQLSPDFFFYRTPGNRHAHFLATLGKKIVGRISAMVNYELRDRDGQPVGALGFFEAVNDYAVARELLDSAIRWLWDDQGIKRIWGPMNFDIWHGYRLMTRGFEQKRFYGEPYNKPYYQDFFERYALTPKQHWNSVEVRGRKTLERLAEPGMVSYGSLRQQGYRFESLKPTRIREELLKLHFVVSRSFSGFLGYTPISPAEFQRLFFSVRYAADPDFFLFAYDPADRLCGFVAGLLDLADGVRAMHGRNNWLAKSRFFFHRRRVDRTLLHLIGKTPEENHKHNGLGAALFSHAFRAISAKGYETLVMTLMAQGSASRRFLQELAADDRRQYTLYEWNR